MFALHLDGLDTLSFRGIMLGTRETILLRATHGPCTALTKCDLVCDWWEGFEQEKFCVNEEVLRHFRCLSSFASASVSCQNKLKNMSSFGFWIIAEQNWLGRKLKHRTVAIDPVSHHLDDKQALLE